MPCEDQRAGVPDLQRERGVDDVRRGEAVVDPAALRAELLGHGVDERGDVVVGRPLDLGDALRRRRRRAARGSRRRPRRGSRRPRPSRRARPARPRASAPACPPPTRSGSSPAGSSGRSLANSVEPGSGGAQRDRGSARRARRRSSRCRRRPSRPARRAASGRSRAARRARRARDIDERSGTPITGSSVCAATTPGQRRGEAGAADQHLQPAPGRRLRVLGDRVGVAVRRAHLELPRDPARVELVERGLHPLAVGLRADEDPDDRLSHRPPAAMSVRWRAPSKRDHARRPRTRARAPPRRFGPVAGHGEDAAAVRDERVRRASPSRRGRRARRSPPPPRCRRSRAPA